MLLTSGDVWRDTLTPHRPRQPGTEQKSAVRRAVGDMLARRESLSLQSPGEEGGGKRGTVRLSIDVTNNEAMLSAQG